MSQDNEKLKRERKRRGRGEGSIEELKDGKFRVFVLAGRNPVTGKWRRLSKTFVRKKDALAWLRDRLTEKSKGILADAGKMTVGEWLDKWLEIKKGKIEPQSWVYYFYCAR